MLQSRLGSNAFEVFGAFCDSPGGSNNSNVGLARLEHVRVRHYAVLGDFLIRLIELSGSGRRSAGGEMSCL